jgi:uncharacterized protein (TIGR02145 family)
MNKLIIILSLFSSICFSQPGLEMFMAQNVQQVIDTNTTVTIGTQTWMVYNLKVVKYNDNTSISKITDNTAWKDATTAAYCWYDNDSATYSATYGALYNGYVIATNKICPVGWHVPDTTEFNTLISYLGGLSVSGKHMRATGLTYWLTPNTDADNSSGFNLLGATYRSYIDGGFGLLKAIGYISSKTQNSPLCYGYYSMYNSTYLVRQSLSFQNGLSVRCIKD